MLLSSAETGEPVALLADGGHLTDVRTAAVVGDGRARTGAARPTLGILGTGIQARLQAAAARRVLPIERIVHLGPHAGTRRSECARDLARASREVAVVDVARRGRARRRGSSSLRRRRARRCCFAHDIQPGTHISAVGSDSPGQAGTRPRDPARAPACCSSIRAASVRIWVNCSTRPTRRSARRDRNSASAARSKRGGITVCDFTGLGRRRPVHRGILSTRGA